MTASEPVEPEPARPDGLLREVAVPTLVLGAVTIATVALAFWGRELARQPPGFPGRGSPWFGVWRASPVPWGGLALAAAFAAVIVWWWPSICRRARWWAVVATAVALTGAWSVVVAAADGWHEVTDPMTTETEYLAVLPAVRADPARFVATYVEQLPSRPIHVQGHPPGQVVVLWAMDRLGLGGAGWATAQAIGFGALGTAFVLVALRRFTDEETARRGAVFCGLAPAVLTLGTSTDAAFVGVATAAVACGAYTTLEDRRLAALAGFGSGLASGALLYLTYGGPTFLGPLLLPAVALVRSRRWLPVLTAVAGFVAVAVAFLLAGFWWFDGLNATRELYAAGVASARPYHYFVLANLAVAALAIGPAALVGLTKLRDLRLVALVAAASAGLLMANFSGLSKGEVERIWLPFFPWLALAALPLARSERSARCWLAAQLLVTLAGQAAFRSPW